MLVKILGFVDFIAAIALFALSFGLNIPAVILGVFAAILFAKGIFIFFGDIASGMDWIAAVVFVLAIFYHIPLFFLILAGFLLLQKGFFSIIA